MSSLEVADKEGVRSVIQRHFIYIVKEVEAPSIEKHLPCVYVLKEHNSRERIEKFSCRIKGAMFVIIDGRPYIILFMHSLKIKLSILSTQTLPSE